MNAPYLTVYYGMLIYGLISGILTIWCHVTLQLTFPLYLIICIIPLGLSSSVPVCRRHCNTAVSLFLFC